MLKIRNVVKNVKAESKKVGYDPEIGTNWCHLPIEIREKCIGDMNFQTRTCLRRTSSIEKSLVDRKKYHFDHVEILHIDKEIKVCTRNKKLPKREKELDFHDYRTPEKKFECTLNILKTCDIRCVKFIDHGVFQEMSDEFLDKFRAIAPFGFRRLTVEGMQMKAVRMMLENCGPLERLTLSLYGPRYPFEQIVGIPSVINAPELRITHSPPTIHHLWRIVQKWIEIDAQIGKSLQFVSHSTEIFETFASKFADRLIENDGLQKARIRMNDESKHILLRKIGSHRREGDDGFFRDMYMSCKVIASDLPESEYGIGDKWIKHFLVGNDPVHSFRVPYELDSDESDMESDSDEDDYSDDSSDPEEADLAAYIANRYLQYSSDESENSGDENEEETGNSDD